MAIDLNLVPLLPEIFLALTGMGLLLVGAAHGNDSTRVISWAVIVAFLFSAIILFNMGWQDALTLGGMFRFDYFAGFMQTAILAGMGLSLALGIHYLHLEGISRFEYPLLVIFACVGMMLMVSANNFLALYVSLELQSLSLYVLAAFSRNSLRSAEAGVKYFALGAISSGMLLFGISLIYGYTGSIDYGAVTASLMTLGNFPPGVIFGMTFILAGLAFKISAAPFHMWTPDVYQGAPTSVTALFAIVPKVAAMGLLMRLLYSPFAPLHDEWLQIIYFLSAMSMILGAFAAIAQENIKRLMAYSSIGNMGYALIGVAAGSAGGIGAVALYMLIYLIMTAGTFGVILSMRRNGAAVENLRDLSGLSRTSPALAYVMAILMFSMSGIPPMAGFFGKLVIFQAAVDSKLYILAVIGVLSSVVAAYYYLKIIKVMFFDEASEKFDAGTPFAQALVIALSVIFVLAFVLKPSYIIGRAQEAALSLFSG